MRINPTRKTLASPKNTNISAILETLKSTSLNNTIANADYVQVEKRDWNGDFSERYKTAR